MYKNQLQELAQRSCFNLPSYACLREGPNHAPRFKASVNFKGEIFESPSYCTTLRQAEHAAAQVALTALSTRGISRSLTARVLDETGVYKNLLQETAHRAGVKLPVYTTVRAGPGHAPVFTCNVELAGMNFKGEVAKTKKQAEKNAAIAAWSSLKTMPNLLVSLFQLTNKAKEFDQTNNIAKVVSNFGQNDETKTSRRWNHNQAAERILMQANTNCAKYQQKKLQDLLSNKTSFASLLPPPPPRTASILNSRSPCPLDEHQKDEGPNKSTSSLFHGGKLNSALNSSRPLSCVSNSTVKLKSLVLETDHRTQCEQNHMGKRVVGAPNQAQMGVNMMLHNNGGCSDYYYSQRFAPVVQVRSVIPVHAAPSPLMRPPIHPTLLKQEASDSAAAGNSMSSVQNGVANTSFNGMK